MKNKAALPIPLRVIAFLLLFCMLFLALECFFFDSSETWPAWKSLQSKEEEPPDILIMGNSNAYTTLNALYLSQIFDKNIQILASSAQIMPITLENLKVILKYQTPPILIVEMNAVIADAKENLQGSQKGVVLNNFDGISNYWNKLRAVSSFLQPEDILEGMFQLLRPTLSYKRLVLAAERVAGETGLRNPYEKYNMNGYSWRNTISQSQCSDIAEKAALFSEKRKNSYPASIPDYNEKAFLEFLNLASKNGIEVWILKSPSLEIKVNQVEKVSKLAAASPAVTYIDDLTECFEKIGLTMEDYYDAGHLNRRGAAKTTRYYAGLIEERLGWERRENVFAYQDEKIEETENGQWKYTMYNEDPGTLYRFQLIRNGQGKVIESQDFSAKNEFILKENILFSDTTGQPLSSPEFRLEVTMLPGDEDYRDAAVIAEKGMKLPFLQYNESVLE